MRNERVQVFPGVRAGETFKQTRSNGQFHAGMRNWRLRNLKLNNLLRCNSNRPDSPTGAMPSLLNSKIWYVAYCWRSNQSVLLPPCISHPSPPASLHVSAAGAHRSFPSHFLACVALSSQHSLPRRALEGPIAGKNTTVDEPDGRVVEFHREGQRRQAAKELRRSELRRVGYIPALLYDWMERAGSGRQAHRIRRGWGVGLVRRVGTCDHIQPSLAGCFLYHDAVWKYPCLWICHLQWAESSLRRVVEWCLKESVRRRVPEIPLQPIFPCVKAMILPSWGFSRLLAVPTYSVRDERPATVTWVLKPACELSCRALYWIKLRSDNTTEPHLENNGNQRQERPWGRPLSIISSINTPTGFIPWCTNGSGKSVCECVESQGLSTSSSQILHD